jgi:hypothetical protein
MNSHCKLVNTLSASELKALPACVASTRTWSDVMKIKKFIAVLIVLGCSQTTHSNAAQVFVVEPPPKSAANAPPTMTLLNGVENAQVTLVAIPGGEGRIGLNETSTGTRAATAVMLNNLTRADFATSRFNIVIFDSPYDIYPYNMRRSADHLDRIESVVRYYKAKFNKPVWLLGHSWGSVSVTEFINKSSENRALLAGLITSASLHEIEIKDGVNMPVLFLHHEQDDCRETPYSYAQKNFEKTKALNKGVTEFATVKGGDSRGNPCRDGRHMFFGAYEEAAKLIDQFIKRNSVTGE